MIFAEAEGGALEEAWISARLEPGRSCRISEDEWRHFLMLRAPLHQWGAAFLFDEGTGGCVRVYLRDDGAAARHTCLRLDERRSVHARQGVAAVEAASRHAADVISAGQRQASRSPDELEAEERASRAFVETAEALYRRLLRP